MQEWIALRNTSIQIHSNIKNSIWFHAASGEIEYVKPLINQLYLQYPKKSIIVTYSSKSAEKLFENIKNQVTQFIPIPWDQPRVIQKLIKSIHPDILIFSRTDFWPEMIEQCHEKTIPIIAVSYFNKSQALSFLSKKLVFNKMSYISCVDLKTASLFKDGLAQADGDSRFDQVFWRLNQPSKVKITSSNKIFVAGSTWGEDEESLKPLFDQLIQDNYQIVWSPHEISSEKISKIQTYLKNKNYTSRLLSTQVNFNFSENFLIVDTVGYLADIYRFATFAFVGGSFKEKIHSVMEPLCCGIPVLVGPYYENNPEAVKFKKEKFIFVAQNSIDLINNYAQIKNLNLQEFKRSLTTQLEQNKNVTEKIRLTLEKNFLKN